MVRKIKIGKIEVSFSDRWLYTFIVIGVIILLGIVVYAVAPNPGHSYADIESCAEGQILKTSGGSWSCGTDVDTDTDNQELSITGQTLSIIGGNAVLLPSASGGCYVSYTNSCLAGFTNEGSIGSFGHCSNRYNDKSHFRPPGTGCTNGWSAYTLGTAYVCCK